MAKVYHFKVWEMSGSDTVVLEPVPNPHSCIFTVHPSQLVQIHSGYNSNDSSPHNYGVFYKLKGVSVIPDSVVSRGIIDKLGYAGAMAMAVSATRPVEE